MSEGLHDFVRMGELPLQAEQILPLLSNEDGTYLDQEGTIWDFKESWPFSYSDAYFAGICRLVCAFANTEGGLIIFGVNDKNRKGGLTKVRPNLDRFEQAFKDLTGDRPHLQVKHYESGKLGAVDILLVGRKDASARPLRFQRDLHNYSKEAIYIRNGSEVRAATSNDVATLYLRADHDENLEPPKGQLPPSPATVREFVGRMDAVDRIFHWLTLPDEPRAFLYGKGGSGKSTIAYQVYKSIKISGGGYKVAGVPLDRLIFISAKARFLDVEKQESATFVGLDFQNECELYQAILVLADFDLDNKRLNELDYLRNSIRELFDTTSCFIVIDDIDTLSTAHEETGMDFLFGALWRARKPSKVLYTLRNRPTQSLSSSLEIPGMKGAEFETFVSVCARQFGVQEPGAATRDTMILPTSEGRPLVIESIIALRRTTGNYPDAVRLFESEAGNDVRDYVFKREWDALDKTDRGREILTILALYDKPISVEDIATISRLDASKIRDALASVQEIFLTSEVAGEETIYSIGPLTGRFVLASALNLNLYETIKTRVQNFKNTFYADSPSLNRFVQRFHRAAAAQLNGEDRYLRLLLDELDREKNPQVAEDPRFLCLRATARLTLDRRDLSRARLDFQSAMDFRHCPEADQLMLWLRAEKAGDSGDKMTQEILHRVLAAKGYDISFKTRVMFDRACYLYIRGKSSISTEPHGAVDLLKESLALHLQSYRSFSDINSPLLSRSEEYCRNTCFTLGNHLNNSSDSDQMFSILAQATKGGRTFVDPVVEPLLSVIRESLHRVSRQGDALQRKIGRFEKMISDLTQGDVWQDKRNRVYFEKTAADLKSRYRGALKVPKL